MSIFHLVWRRRRFFALVWAPLAIACSAATYKIGLVEAYLWFQMNGGRMSYGTQREIAHNLLWLKVDVDAYKKKHGKLPARLADVDLAAFREHGEPVRLDAQGQPLDPWGRPYLYAVNAERCDLRSLGRDGRAGGTRLDTDVSLDQGTWDYQLPGLSEFLQYQAEMPERSETTVITWFCALCPVLVFAGALIRRLRGKNRMHAVLWVPCVTAGALLSGVMAGPILFVVMLLTVIVVAIVSAILSIFWLIFSYWSGRPVPPMMDH